MDKELQQDYTEGAPHPLSMIDERELAESIAWLKPSRASRFLMNTWSTQGREKFLGTHKESSRAHIP